ncbi:MAG: glycoside-pentoside-hexuronide (GPH):cation symporter [Chloroflexota bacterium]
MESSDKVISKEKSADRDLLSLRSKLMYGVGDAGINMADTVVGLLFAIFLTDVVGIRPGIAALVIFLGRTFDYINDPIIGYISDRTRTRWGRRRPFILFGMLPFALVYMLLWWIPPITNQTGLAIYYAAAFILYDTFATVLYMPYFALTPELTSDYDERTSLTTYRMVFSTIGAMIAFVVPLAIIGTMGPENAQKIMAVGAGVAVISTLPMLAVFFGTREKSEYQDQKQPGLKESILAAFQNKPFLYATGIFLFGWTALDITQATLMYFLKYRMNLAENYDMVFGLLFVAALISLPGWNWVAAHLDKKKAVMIGMLFLSVSITALGFINPSWGLPAVLGCTTLVGFGLGAIQVLTWAMIPDAVEWDEYKTGQRHEGMFYSLVQTLRKVASSLSLPFVLLMLEWTGYVANASVQPAKTIFGIQALIGPIPSIFLIIGIFFAYRYPLSRKVFDQVRAELAARAEQGKSSK